MSTMPKLYKSNRPKALPPKPSRESPFEAGFREGFSEGYTQGREDGEEYGKYLI